MPTKVFNRDPDNDNKKGSPTSSENVASSRHSKGEAIKDHMSDDRHVKRES